MINQSRTTPCVLLDVDNTLIDVRGLQNLTEARSWGITAGHTFHEAAKHADPFPDILKSVLAFQEIMPVIVMTARHEEHRDITWETLERHGVSPTLMYMRQEERQSSHHAKELSLDKVFALGYDPVLAFEDDPDTIEMYKGYDIPVVIGEGWPTPSLANVYPYAGRIDTY